MDIKKYLKNPKVLGFGIFIFVIVIVIFIIIMLKPTPNSPSGVCGQQKSYKCGDTIQCGPSCRDDDQTWDCDKKKCVCKDSTKKDCVGNTQCCTECDNDMCCSQENQVKSGDTSACCSPGAVPNAEKTSCVVICGGKPCDPGKDCVSVSNLSPTDLANMQKQEGYVSTDAKNVVYFCNSPPKCMFSTHSNLPGGDTTEGADYFYNTGTIFNGVEGESVCFPKSPDPNSDCYSKISQEDCGSGCNWIDNVFDEFVVKNTNPTDYDDFKKHMENLNVINKKSTIGYYCGDGSDSFGRFEVTTGTGTCDVTACINNITNDGTIRVNWDQKTNTCSSLKGPNSALAGGVTSQIRCTGNKTPCPNCTKEGDLEQCNDKPSSTWDFTPCKTTPTNVAVLKYSPGDPNSGNCPWGSNTLSDITQDGSDPSGYHGLAEIGGKTACYSDGQIKNIPDIKYKLVSDKNNKGDLCQKCDTIDNDCIYNDSGCKNAVICGGLSNTGYIPNNLNTSCNYICTIDGTDAATNNDDRQTGVKNFAYKSNKNTALPPNLCYRKQVLGGDEPGNTCNWSDCTRNGDIDLSEFKKDSDFIHSGCFYMKDGTCAAKWLDAITPAPVAQRGDTVYLYEYPMDSKQKISDDSDYNYAVSCFSKNSPQFVQTARDYWIAPDPAPSSFFCNHDPPT